MPLTQKEILDIHFKSDEELLKAYEDVLIESFKVQNFPSKKSLAKLAEREAEIKRLILYRMIKDDEIVNEHDEMKQLRTIR
jgi:hypothetical protein